MTKQALCLVALLACATPAVAYDGIPKHPGEITERISGHVTGQATETVALEVGQITPIGDNDAAWLSRLVVLDAHGKALWRGPKLKDGQDPQAFSSGPGGLAALQAAGPLERAGQNEVVVMEPQSDVSVPRFRVMRWNGHALAYVRTASLVEAKPGQFAWTPHREPHGRRWVSRIVRITAPGHIEVELMKLKGNDVEGQKAVLAARGAGFTLVK